MLVSLTTISKTAVIYTVSVKTFAQTFRRTLRTWCCFWLSGASRHGSPTMLNNQLGSNSRQSGASYKYGGPTAMVVGNFVVGTPAGSRKKTSSRQPPTQSVVLKNGGGIGRSRAPPMTQQSIVYCTEEVKWPHRSTHASIK